MKKTHIQNTNNEKLSSVYFMSGKNDYKINEAVKTLKKRVLTPGFETFDLEKFDAGEGNFDFEELKRSIYTPPMASKKRLIILTRIEKMDGNVRKKFLTILKNPAETSILVMVQSPEYKKKSKFLNKIASLSKRKSFRNLYTKSLKGWINEYFVKQGYSVEENVAEEIIKFMGKDQISITGEMEKIITYIGENRKITKKDAVSVLSSNKVKNVFQLTDAIGKRDLNESLSIVNYLMEWGEEPEKIFAIIRSFFLRLRSIFYYRKENLSLNQITKKLGKARFIIEKDIECLKRFTQTDLEDRLVLIYKEELKMKTGGNKKLILTELVYNLI